MFRIARLLFALCAFTGIGIAQPTYNLRFQLANNDGRHYDVRLQMNGSVAFANGGSNITFNYNTGCLSSPMLLTAHAFSSEAYTPLSMTEPLPGCVSVNIEYDGSAGGGANVIPAPSWMDVATIRFTVKNPQAGSELLFRQAGTLQSPTVQYLDDMKTVLAPGEFTGLNTRPMPMEVLVFSGRMKEAVVQLDWRTGKQSSSSDFIVERADPSQHEWMEIGSVPASTTTGLEHAYTFTDNKPLALPSILYRLKQIDKGGSIAYSNILEVGKAQPTGFDLLQNYPNPAALSTAIPFVLPSDANVRLTILDTNGKLIREIVAADFPAGQHSVNMPVSDLSSGVYQYCFKAGSIVLTRRMTVTR